MKYAWIQKQRDHYPLELFCRVMEVSVSGYLEHHRRPSSNKAQEDAKITEVLREVYQEGRATYGITRLHLGLRNRGVHIGLHRTRSLVNAAGLEWVRKKSFRVTTTDSNHTYPVANNILDRRFDEVPAPNRTRLSDITYVPTDEGWLYLCTIKDSFTKKIVGWAMEDHMQSSLISRTLAMAIRRQQPEAELLHHSDRGSQYCSHDYQRMLSSLNITCSMSRKGNCWDNAPMESFFGRLKNKSLHHHHFRTQEEARGVIFDYIGLFYNPIRIQEGLGGKSPVQFEKEWFQKQQTQSLRKEAA